MCQRILGTLSVFGQYDSFPELVLYTLHNKPVTYVNNTRIFYAIFTEKLFIDH